MKNKLNLGEAIKNAVREGIKKIDLIYYLVETNQLSRIPRKKEGRVRFDNRRNYSERKKKNPKGGYSEHG